jgi:hypothetical protein
MKHASLVKFSKTMKIWKLPITSDWFDQLKVKNFYVEWIKKQVKQMGGNRCVWIAMELRIQN